MIHITNEDEKRFELALIERGYISKEGCPIKCACGSDSLREEVRDIIEHSGWMTSELEMMCNDCGNSVGYWAYGYWNSPLEYYIDVYEQLMSRIEWIE